MSALDVETLNYEEKEIFAPDLETLRSGKQFPPKYSIFYKNISFSA